MIYTASRLRQVSIAALLLSLGVILGTLAPRASGAGAQPRGPSPAAARTVSARVPRPAPAIADTGVPDPEPPASPSFQPEPPGQAPSFAGSYAVLRGAATDASIAAPAAAAAPPADASPAFPAAPATAVPPDTASSAPEPRPSPAPTPFRPAPAQGFPRGLAADYPLLAVFEGAGRVVFYDLGVRPGVVPVSIEGTWSPLGGCGRALQADFSAPTAGTGELRAVGRADPQEPGTAFVAVARQGCEAASARFSTARPASDADRAELGVGAPDGFGASDLVQVARAPGLVLAVFRSAAGSVAVVSTSGSGGPAALWTGRAAPGDGELTAIGVFRKGGAAHAWLVLRRGTRPTALLAASTADGRVWSSPGPIPLVNH